MCQKHHNGSLHSIAWPWDPHDWRWHRLAPLLVFMLQSIHMYFKMSYILAWLCYLHFEDPLKLLSSLVWYVDDIHWVGRMHGELPKIVKFHSRDKRRKELQKHLALGFVQCEAPVVFHDWDVISWNAIIFGMCWDFRMYGGALFCGSYLDSPTIFYALHACGTKDMMKLTFLSCKRKKLLERSWWKGTK